MRQVVPAAGVDVVVLDMGERLRLVVSGAIDVLFDSSLKCARVHLPSGVLLVLEVAVIDELGFAIEVEAEHCSSLFGTHFKPVCFFKRLNRNQTNEQQQKPV